VRHRALTGLEQVEEFAARMRPTRQFDARFERALILGMGAGGRKQGFVAGVVVDHEVALPGLQTLLRMPAAATGLIVEDEDLGSRLQVVTAVGPQLGFLGLAVAEIQLRHRRFIGMQTIALQQVPGQAIRQRL